MANENVVLKVLFDTSEAIPSAKNLDKVMQGTTKSTDALNQSLNVTTKELSEFDKNIKGGADGLKNLAQAKKNFNDISIASSTKEVKDLANELQNTLLKNKEFMKVGEEVAQKFKQGIISEAEALDILEKAINKGVQSTNTMKVRTSELVTQTSSFKAEMSDLANQINNGDLSGADLDIAIKRLSEMKAQSKDLNERLKILGSDTRLITTAMAGLQIGVGIFASLQGASALFGENNQKVQQALLRVTGAMAVLQGLEQIQNGLKKDSVFLTGLQATATSAYGLALRVVTAIQVQFGVSSATAWAIATGGVTLLITAIGLLIYNYKEVSKYVTDFLGISKELTAQQKLQAQYSQDYANVQKQVIENGGKEIANVIKLGIAIKDQNLPQDQRLLALKEYNKLAEEGNKIDETQINNTALIEEALKRQTDLIIKKAIAKASENEIEKIITSTLQARLEVEAVQKSYGSFLKMSSEEVNKLVQAGDSYARAYINNSVNYFKNIGLIEDADKRVRKLLSFSPVELQTDSIKSVSTKTLKVKPEKVEVDIKDIQIKNNKASLLNLTGGFTKELDGLQETLKDFKLNIPLKLEDVNIDDTLKYIESVKQSFLKATSGIGGDFSGLFGGLGSVTAGLFDLKKTQEAIREQRLVIDFAYKELERTKLDFNKKMKEANKQLADAEKDGNENRIKEAKKTVDELQKEYDKSIESQTSNINKQKATLSSLQQGFKKAAGQIATAIGDVFLGVTKAISSTIDRNIAKLDKLIEAQKVNVAEAKKIADKGNSQLYDAELKKEAKLEQLRREQSRKKKAIAIAEILINTAVGIANVWAQWGSQFPSGPAIAGVLTGLLGALSAVQIGVVASQTFKKGGKVPTGMMKGASHEQGGIKFGVQGRSELYEMEGDEFIFNRETSLKNAKWFDKINNEKIDLDHLLASVRLDSMQLNPVLSTTFVNQNGQLEDRLIQVEKAIIDLPNRMPQTSFNADSRGLSMTMKKIIDKEKAWKR